MTETPAPDQQRSAGLRSFGRVVLAGLASGTLAAVAGHRNWVSVHADGAQAQSLATAAVSSGAAVAESPAAGALALVVLAAWGVLLVTRRRVRRVVAVLACLASVGLVVAVVAGWSGVPDAVRTTVGDVGSPLEIGHTIWFWLTGVGAVLSVATTAVAVRLVGSWPEMGTRYDAPVGPTDRAAAAVADDVPIEDQTSIDLWKSIDEGRDPTA